MIKKIDEKTEQYTYYYDRIRKTIVDHKVQDLLCLLLQATLFDFEGLTIKELVKYSDFSDSTVRNYLKRDEVIRIINENSSEKPFRYSLDLDKL